MSNSQKSNAWLSWALGLILALFVIIGFVRLFQKWFGDDSRGAIQQAVRADLDLVLKAEKEFKGRFGFYTTDLVGLGIKPKYVFYKFGFTRAAADESGAQAAVPGLDSSRMDLDKLKAAQPNMVLDYSDRTGLETIRFETLSSFCDNCTATRETFKAIAAANLDDDPVLDVWTIDQDGKVEHLVDDLSQ